MTSLLWPGLAQYSGSMRDEDRAQIPFDAEPSNIESLHAADSSPENKPRKSAPESKLHGMADNVSESSANPFAVHGKGLARLNPLSAILIVALAAALIFGGAFAIGRYTTDPLTNTLTNARYKQLTSSIAETKKQIANNKQATKKLTAQRDDLREEAKKAADDAAANKKSYDQYMPANGVADQPVSIESLNLVTDDLMTWGADVYYNPQVTFRNTSGHIVYEASFRYDIIGSNGDTLEKDDSSYIGHVILYPGKTAVSKGSFKNKNYSGATVKLTGYYLTVYDANSGSSHQKTTEYQIDGKAPTAVIP